MSYFEYNMIGFFKKGFKKERQKLLRRVISKRLIHINIPPAMVYSVKLN